MFKSVSLLALLSLLFTTYNLFADAPTASGVQIIQSQPGTVYVGHTFTGVYTFADNDGDAEDGSLYVWYRADDAIGNGKLAITGQNSLTYTLTSADANKYVSFEVTPRDENGDLGTAVESFLFRVLPDPNTGIANAVNTIEAKVYPNPFADNVVVELSNDIAETGYNVTVVDITGKQVATLANQTTPALTLALNVPAGIYFCEINSPKGVRRVKLVK